MVKNRSIFVLLVLLKSGAAINLFLLDNTAGLGRTFDGIGGLSGGSATSKLLADYKEPQRTEILDYLFEPNFAASLQILKVEIGGDAIASDATEASHMHNSWEENYQRGYEWWLMKEAKKRNPNIKLYGLPWDFPGWIGNGTGNPYKNAVRLATYITKWIQGAKVYHNLDIDYIGIWNERPYDVAYIKTLRLMLDQLGFENTHIVAADGGFSDIVEDMYKDAELSAAIDIIGVHYPGTLSPQNAMQLGKTLWSSEDYSTVDNTVGGGCWARILNQNYVKGYMTSTIAWNLIDSYLEGLSWDRDSLMTAREPWSGFYIVESPIWVTAHTTQFSSPGWSYLRHGYGVGLLEKGGSIVSLTSPDNTGLTVVIETMSHNQSVCIRPPLPTYSVEPQNISLILMGDYVDIKELQVWYTKLGGNTASSVYFSNRGSVPVQNGLVTLSLGVNEIYTLTTLTTGKKGQYPDPPASQPFPIDYYSFFYELNDSSEAPYFSAQQGVYEIVSVSEYEKHLRQMVLEPPIVWCGVSGMLNATMNVLGSDQWTDIYVKAETFMVAVNGSKGVYIAARIDSSRTGCETSHARGLFFYIIPDDQLFFLTEDLGGSIIITGGRSPAIDDVHNVMELLVLNGFASGKVNSVDLFNVSIPHDASPAGFVGIGTDSFGYADFGYIITRNASNALIWKEDKTLRFQSRVHK